MTDFIIATLVIVVGGSILLIGIYLAVQLAAWERYFSGRDYGEKLDYGDDIYGESLMDVDDD